MRQFLLIILVFYNLSVSAQVKNLPVPLVNNSNKTTVPQPDTTLRASYVTKHISDRNPAYYINGEFVNESIIQTLNPNIIKNIRVEHNELTNNNKKYYGQIFIEIKEDCTIKLISLADLKQKYTDLNKESTLFMINNDLINDDYNEYLIDENFVLKITIEKIENKEEKLNFSVIRILTKTPENIKKSKEIRIRGLEEVASEK
jgi:hypothetical protein